MTEPIDWENLDDEELLAAANELIDEEPMRPELVELALALRQVKPRGTGPPGRSPDGA